MPTYLFRCRTCSAQYQSSSTHMADDTSCTGCLGPLIRDYKAEGANVAITNLKQAREAGK